LASGLQAPADEDPDAALVVQIRLANSILEILQEGESKKLIRDLYDLFLLLQQHGVGAGRQQIDSRAEELRITQSIPASWPRLTGRARPSAHAR